MLVTTIGHSTLDWWPFERLLAQHSIGCVVDVRTYPRSRLPHFSSPALRVLLNRIGISYLFLGDQLGGRPRSGPNRYEEMAKSIAFQIGIARLLEVAPRTRVAMLCAEAEPLECHRLLLVARHLASLGIEIKHIHRDGTVEPQHDAEERLLSKTRVKPDLLRSREERLAEAYHRAECRLRGEPA